MAAKNKDKKVQSGKEKGTQETGEVGLKEVKEALSNRWLQLVIVLLLGSFFRLFQLGYPYFLGADTSVHYSVFRTSFNLGYVPEIYELSTYPKGFEITEPLGLYYTALLPAWLIGNLEVFKVILPILGILSILVLFFASRRNFNNKLALIFALILATSAANVYRTQANLYRGDAIFFLIFSLTLLMVLNYTRDQEKLYIILSGLLMAISPLFWNGYPLLFAFFAANFALQALFAFFKDDNKGMRSQFEIFFIASAISTISIKVMSLFFNIYNLVFVDMYLVLFLPGISAIYVLFYLLNERVVKNNIQRIAVTLLMVAGGFVVLYLNLPHFESLLTGFGLLQAQSGFFQTVAELTPTSFQDMFELFNVLTFIFPVGLALFIYRFKKWESKDVVILAWAVVSIYLLVSSRRFMFHASYCIAFLSAYLLVEIVSTLSKREIFGEYSKDIFNMFILLVVVLSASLSYSYASTAFVPSMDENLFSAIQWLDSNTETNEAVATFWDIGGAVQAYANRPTLTDSVYGQHFGRISELNVFLVNNSPFNNRESKYLLLDKLLLFRLPLYNISYVQFDAYSVLDNGERIQFQDQESGMVIEVYPQLYPNVGFVVSGDTRIPIAQSIFQIDDQVHVRVAVENITSFHGCFYYSYETPMWVDENLCATNYFQLSYGPGVAGFEQVYRNEEVVIYEIQ
jgi:asparagine N-glycosylation enzyme membrane subunit Stt3